METSVGCGQYVFASSCMQFRKAESISSSVQPSYCYWEVQEQEQEQEQEIEIEKFADLGWVLRCCQILKHGRAVQVFEHGMLGHYQKHSKKLRGFHELLQLLKAVL